MLKVALTGGIACGKSLVGSFMAKLGAAVCDSDRLAREVMRPDGAAYAGIASSFGRGILDARTGAIDRGILGRRVFANPLELARLNALVHPHARKAWRAWLKSRPRRTGVAVLIVPLLYEAGMEKEWDVVVCVWASPRNQMARLRMRGLTPSAARRRIDAQMAGNAKMTRADFVIANNGARRLLLEQTTRVWRRIEEVRKHAGAGVRS
ncbi:MAG: dephospho-CoA kinase [Verrucomicrobiota bacterium]|nr:dephospho-CoA kinase [Verrucomicrobiota bacterium]